MKPYPKPLGNDGKLPLLSSNADVFHAARAHRGTVLKDSYFINSGEDSALGGIASACRPAQLSCLAGLRWFLSYVSHTKMF